VVAGLAGFALKYAGYFERKATSVSARFDYWQAAVQTARNRPVFGTGPGTFAIAYLQVKRPESRNGSAGPQRLSAAGVRFRVLGFAAYVALMVGYCFTDDLEPIAAELTWFGPLFGLDSWAGHCTVYWNLDFMCPHWPGALLHSWADWRRTGCPHLLPGSPDFLMFLS
jgi:hypothetical protein